MTLLLAGIIAPDISSPPWQWVFAAWSNNYGTVLKGCGIVVAVIIAALLLEKFLRKPSS